MHKETRRPFEVYSIVSDFFFSSVLNQRKEKPSNVGLDQREDAVR